MITNFEEITSDLTKDELKLISVLVYSFNKRTKDNPIKAPQIVQAMNNYLKERGEKLRLSEPRLRKLVNYIRVNGMIPLIATSNGYYVSYNRQEIVKQINSLNERATSIKACADGLNKFLAPIA
jgi:hypothetical protein